MGSVEERIRTSSSAFDRALAAGAGIVRLAPAWVPRSFCTPGKRLRLHPDDYFPFGAERGGIDERWLASGIRADNGLGTAPYEGLSLVVDPTGSLLPFDEFIDHHGAALIGDRLWNEHRRWPMYAKFFDNRDALPFHLHHRDRHAQLVGKSGKPEAYYYPPQMNSHLGGQPMSYLGLLPGTTPEQFRQKLAEFDRGGDNEITALSRGYRTRLGTGWDIPGGVLHAPASVCTYEPQADCDVFCMCESWSNNREVPVELLWKDVPDDRRGDLDFILDLVDWPANTDPEFDTRRFMQPFPTTRSVAEGGENYIERWVVFRSPCFSAKELTVQPGRSVTLTDPDPYGAIAVQGHGEFGGYAISSATMLRYGDLSEDEFFVSEQAARAGVRIRNNSRTENLVLLKHFGPGNSELSRAAIP